MFYNGSQFDDGTERVFVWVINTGLQIRTNVSSSGKRTNLVFNNYIKCNATGWVCHVCSDISSPAKTGRGALCVLEGGGEGEELE